MNKGNIAPSHNAVSPPVTDDILRLIYEGTAVAMGEDFFRALVRATATAMQVHFCFVAEFAGCRERVRTLAYWKGRDFTDNVEFDLHGTVCEDVLTGQVRYYPEGVQALFPREPVLAELGIQSYLATPMTDRHNEVLGHLAVCDLKPMQFRESELAVFKIFGARAAAELERMYAVESLRHSEERLSNILASATDAIVTIDGDRHITLFNQAAEQVFRCSAAWAMGQPFDRLLSPSFRQLIRPLFEGRHPEGQKIWAPEGLTAVRADGEEFPVEATVSPLQVSGTRLYTIILRDINERELARQEIYTLQAENFSLQEEMRRRHGFSEMIGDSSAMREVFEQIAVVATTDASVLLIGETGTGKELIARALHERSKRKDRLMVSVNCAALPSELIESELFGHEKGAFTGATAQRKGRFELADKGTIFLDEVGELTAQAQAKLLRILQQQSFERVGGTTTLHIDARVIAATNRDLAEMVKDGRFRDDLFYRLNVFPIRVPPLRERRSDIPLLARHFLHKMARKLDKPAHGIDKQSLERLMGYSWPGNVRELQNVIERATILAQGPTLSITDPVFTNPPPMPASEPSAGTLDAVQKSYIVEVLTKCDGRIEGRNGAAAMLNVKPSTLRYRMRRLGIDKPVTR
jgi:formate hydrogenlyase transcriptional activator